MTDFIPIELPKTVELCTYFCRDAFFVSFGNYDKFEAWGAEKYLKKLQDWSTNFPTLCVHFVVDGKIVGQVEARVAENPKKGYVSLFYLTPEMRGQGLGEKLHNYVVEEFRKLGVEEIFLRVARRNKNALKFYQKNGWKVKNEVDEKDEECSLLFFSLLRVNLNANKL